MKLVIFGLTVSSSWGNGHATLWRGLLRALIARGHDVVFFERDVPYYAQHRDLFELPGGRLILYASWDEIAQTARMHADEADAAMVTSYCPDGPAASDLVIDSSARLRTFYDLDTPITLDQLRAGNRPAYLPSNGLGDFDLVLSYTGGKALTELQTLLHARRTAPLYGHVDPTVHHPVGPLHHYNCDLSYLGTYAADRQAALETLLIRPARRLPDKRFVIGGAQYPMDFPWANNIFFVRHLPPVEHPAFFSSSRLTLNITRKAMADYGYCPSGRLFEAAACGCPLLSDTWQGLDTFLTPNKEILLAQSPEDTANALELSDHELHQLAANAKARVLSHHTSTHRAAELENLLTSAAPTTKTTPAQPLTTTT